VPRVDKGKHGRASGRAERALAEGKARLHDNGGEPIVEVDKHGNAALLAGEANVDESTIGAENVHASPLLGDPAAGWTSSTPLPTEEQSAEPQPVDYAIPAEYMAQGRKSKR